MEMGHNSHTHLVIMAGGIGSRLWPSVPREYFLLEPIAGM